MDDIEYIEYPALISFVLVLCLGSTFYISFVRWKRRNYLKLDEPSNRVNCKVREVAGNQEVQSLPSLLNGSQGVAEASQPSRWKQRNFPSVSQEWLQKAVRTAGNECEQPDEHRRPTPRIGNAVSFSDLCEVPVEPPEPPGRTISQMLADMTMSTTWGCAEVPLCADGTTSFASEQPIRAPVRTVPVFWNEELPRPGVMRGGSVIDCSALRESPSM